MVSSANNNTKDQKQVAFFSRPEYPEMDYCVSKWFKQAKDKQIPVSVPVKSEDFSSSINRNPNPWAIVRYIFESLQKDQPHKEYLR